MVTPAPYKIAFTRGGYPMRHKVTPFLWFDSQAEEAMNFYVSIFKNSKILSVNRVGGKVMTGSFELDGQKIMALNAGPKFKFTEAISFFVDCETQEEVDYFWDKLSAGGEKSRCGWLKDKFGLSWQIIPTALGRLMSDPDPKKSQAVFQAMLKMDKIDIGALERAHDQKPV
jgi:predicted 3-demethylubiquinone-9 3-methyltransferase (glyoxalase superfamily)